jgi:O-succinylbenzoic acid--CoA ligase
MITVTAARAATVRWAIPATGAAGRGAWPTRAAVLIELTTAAGEHGLGEAAPLPGRSPDDLAAAHAAVAALAAMLPVTVADVTAAAALAAAITTAPAARFALEAALLDALARAGRTTVAALLADPAASPPPAALAPAIVVDDPATAAAAVAAGARVLKVKVGAADDLPRLAAIRAAAPTARLRLDANGAWTCAEAPGRLAALAELLGDALAFVEEPCADTAALLATRPPCRLALDEGLLGIEPDALARALAAPALAALVLKPTLLGGLTACRALARAAARAGVAAIVSHSLEGPLATAVCGELARALAASAPDHDDSSDRAPGLGPHAGLAGWTSLDPVRDLAHLLAASPDAAPMSLAAAAATDGDRLALITASGCWTFAELAAAAAPHAAPAAGPAAVIATPSVATIAAVHAALAARAPLALLHHRWPGADHAAARARLAAATVPDDTALVLFTSGSTGAPRGVLLPRLALLASAAAGAAHLGWRDDDRWLCALPLAHAGGLAVVVRCLIARRPVVLIEGDADAAAIAAHLAAHAVTLASLVPTQLAALLDDPAWRPPPRLRAILLGGAAAPPALLAAAAARDVPVLTSYGMTETFGQVATARLDDARLVHPDVGVALAGVTLTAGTEAAPAPIRVAGPAVALGYLGEPALPGALTTRDLGWLDAAGGLHVVGRVDDVIITGGENVHPLAVEAALAATPAVHAACAFGVPDARWGERVAAALVVDPGFDLAAAAVGWARALPAHARPRELALVAALPLGPTGKVDRRAAAALPRAPLVYPPAQPA